MFNKLFVSYMATIVILALLIGSVNLYSQSRELRSTYEASAAETLRNVQAGADAILDNVNQLSLQISLIGELNKALADPFQISIHEYGRIKEYLQSQLSANRMLGSIYVYFRLNNRVLTTNEGLYRLDEFYDRAIVEQAVSPVPDRSWPLIRALPPPPSTDKRRKR